MGFSLIKLKKFFKVLGPGLLYAGAAIGVSHLVQSTRAGAIFNYDLVWVLIIANLLKYPFFEYGPRYANATGNNLIDGYKNVGSWAVLLFTVVTVGSMFAIMAAVTAVTAGLLAFVLKITISMNMICLIVLITGFLIIIVGKYSLLDKLIKVIILILAVTTIIAVFSALGIEKEITPEALDRFNWDDVTEIMFMIAFVGWMPAPIDVSVWSSIWSKEKAKVMGYNPKLRDVLLEFRVSYIGTALLALAFLVMGALVMYGTGEFLSENGTIFAGQLITIYTSSLGNWAYWIVSIAATFTMISTTITVMDAYPRVLSPIVENSLPKLWERLKNKLWITLLWFFILIAGTMIILVYAAKSMGAIVGFATTLSFLTAPVLAWLNYRVVTDKHMPVEARPGKFLRILSWVGIAFFTIFTFIYIYWVYVI